MKHLTLLMMTVVILLFACGCTGGGSNSGYVSSGYNPDSNAKSDYSSDSDWNSSTYDSDSYPSDSVSGSDYSSGSEWESYDNNFDGNISDGEFQNAVNDFMDTHGY